MTTLNRKEERVKKCKGNTTKPFLPIKFEPMNLYASNTDQQPLSYMLTHELLCIINL